MTTEPPAKFDPSDQRRPRRLVDAQSEEITFPLAWLVIGGLAALVVIGLLGLGVVNLFRQQTITPTPQELPPIVEEVQPAVAEPVDAPTEVAPAAEQSGETEPAEQSPAETAPEAPPAEALPAAEIVTNSYVTVVGTGGIGVSIRAGPGRNNARLGIAEEDPAIRLFVIDGPRDDENAEDFIWWYIRHPDGTEGWVVQDFLVPSP